MRHASLSWYRRNRRATTASLADAPHRVIGYGGPRLSVCVLGFLQPLEKVFETEPVSVALVYSLGAGALFYLSGTYSVALGLAASAGLVSALFAFCLPRWSSITNG